MKTKITLFCALLLICCCIQAQSQTKISFKEVGPVKYVAREIGVSISRSKGDTLIVTYDEAIKAMFQNGKPGDKVKGMFIIPHTDSVKAEAGIITIYHRTSLKDGKPLRAMYIFNKGVAFFTIIKDNEKLRQVYP